ncbi:diguanylate cyclase [Paenibacillus sp. WQ 127069]|uniref:Diguanylate cyclase n=1 Tax=Paenibacillus baimaensis TaxID=2982185 RepID=A0ABT2UP94_9BACL|nr:histidine kinase N-terminal 7TM domain-containing protein [Paenibacillus sp. WQ 127069]MCU6796465.1 diguanylate cyclase [Paenibacillus sp. WQ 127069]
MTTAATGYITVTIFSAILNLLLTLYIIKKISKTPLSRAYLLLCGFCSLYAFTYAGELASDSLHQMINWIKLEYLFVPFLLPLCLLITIEYTHMGRLLKRSWLWALFVIPSLTVILQLSNDRHGLYFSSIELYTHGPFPVSDVQLGPWFFFDAAYSCTCFVVCIIILFLQWKRASLIFRKQIAAMAITFTIPLLSASLYFTDIVPYGIDVTPASMSLTCLLIGIAIFSFRMFSLTPIAIQAVFESMRDGILVLDEEGRIVRYNQAAFKVIPLLTPAIIGTSADGLIPGLSVKQITTEPSRLITEYDTEVHIGGLIVHYQVRISPILENTAEHHVGVIVSLIDITERIQLLQRLQKLAAIDGLTGIYNRSQFIHACEQQLQQVNRQQEPAVLLLFDIDHFKQVNDSYGHEAGDIALQHVAKVSQRQLRTSDLFGRYGGEEFILWLPRTTKSAALELAEALRSTIEESPVQYNGAHIPLTASFGLAELLPDNQLNQLIREADDALYAAKREGRNRVKVRTSTL